MSKIENVYEALEAITALNNFLGSDTKMAKATDAELATLWWNTGKLPNLVREEQQHRWNLEETETK